jgi:3-hydroxyisobutyrate dehydrogenase-like beta-hydroxyacid dehydrogenase
LAAVEAAVLDTESGVIAAMAPGSTLVDLSTNSLALFRRVASACAARGVRHIDAPVSAVSGPAAEGKLTVMVGGDHEVVDELRPLLELLGSIVHLGDAGAGTVGKLMTQYLGLTNLVAGMEALVVAAKAGVDMDAMLELVPNSIGAFYMFVALRRLAETRDFGEPGKVNGLVEIMNKDLTFAVELAQELGVPHPTGAGAHSVFAETMRRGHGKYHFTRVAQSLEEAAGVEIRARTFDRKAPS